MAKKSMIEREKKRAKIVEKYAAKRAALKAAGDYEGLSKLPANAVSAVLRSVNWRTKDKFLVLKKPAGNIRREEVFRLW